MCVIHLHIIIIKMKYSLNNNFFFLFNFFAIFIFQSINYLRLNNINILQTLQFNQINI